MRPLERTLLRLSAYLVLPLVVIAVLMPVYGCGCSKMAAPRTACLSNLKQQSLGLIMYASDNGERLPERDHWKDAIEPYLKSETAFHEAKAPKGVYGYAFNAALSKAILDGNPKTPIAYDSVNPIRNASDRLTSLPPKGQHGGKNNVAYADGHAKARPAGTSP